MESTVQSTKLAGYPEACTMLLHASRDLLSLNVSVVSFEYCTVTSTTGISTSTSTAGGGALTGGCAGGGRVGGGSGTSAILIRLNFHLIP